MTIGRNFKIGVFAIMALIILFAGMNYLKGQNLFSRSSRFCVFFENVDGLTDSGPVYYSGYKVGSIRSIEICPDKPKEQRFKVVFGLDMSIDVPKDSHADIYSTDILGGKGLDLILGTSREYAESGDTLCSAIRMGLTDQIQPLADKAGTLVSSADSALTNINGLLGGKGGQDLREAIEALDATLKNFNQISKSIEQMTAKDGALTRSLAGLDSLMTSLGKQGANIDKTMNGLGDFAQQLARSNVDTLISTLNTTMGAIGGIVESIDSAQGTIGRMINDSKLYDKLAESSENLNRLLVDVRLNPSRYVKISAINFGKNTYFSDAGNGMAMVGLVYAVSLKKSGMPLDFPTEIDGQKVIEYHPDKKTYEYLMGQYRDKSEAESALAKLKATYSDAVIKAFDSGKEVAL